MVKPVYVCCLVLLIWGIADAQQKRPRSYSNVPLRFRYIPPSELKDGTDRAKAAMKFGVSAKRSEKQFDLLLSMFSGTDDTAPDWHSLNILTLPRSAFPKLNDEDAEAKMNALVAHSPKSSVYPKPAIISGQRFAISVFRLQEGNVRKGAVVWTTVRKGQLLSFAFVANSPAQLQALTETMKSVRFY
jgi:hypothetical protein